MANAPSPIKKGYIHNLYCSITSKPKVCAVEAENQKKIADLKKSELDLKECSVHLCESLLNVTSDDNDPKENRDNNVEKDKDDQSAPMPIMILIIIHTVFKMILDGCIC